MTILIWAGTFVYAMLTVRPYEHNNDNAVLGVASLMSVLVVVLRALGSEAPGLAFAFSTAVGVLALVPRRAYMCE